VFLGSETHPNLFCSDSPFASRTDSDCFCNPKHRSAPIALLYEQNNGFVSFWDPKPTQIRSALIPPFTSGMDSGVFGIRATPKSVLLRFPPLRAERIRVVFGIRNKPKSVLLRFSFFASRTDSRCLWDPKHTQIRSAPIPPPLRTKRIRRFLGSETHQNLFCSDSLLYEQN
jgi:hypothetical protein